MKLTALSLAKSSTQASQSPSQSAQCWLWYPWWSRPVSFLAPKCLLHPCGWSGEKVDKLVCEILRNKIESGLGKRWLDIWQFHASISKRLLTSMRELVTPMSSLSILGFPHKYQLLSGSLPQFLYKKRCWGPWPGPTTAWAEKETW